MRPGPPRIIVTLPARSIAQLQREIAEAKRDGADVGEVRLDRLGPADAPRLGELFPSALPLLATLRSTAEGGEGPNVGAVRRPILELAATLAFAHIDLELDRDFPLPSHSPLLSGHHRLILSHHSDGPPRAVLTAHHVPIDVTTVAFRKFVGPASVEAYLRKVVPAIPPHDEGPVVILTTGPSGGLSRAWARRFAFPAVFASPSPRGANGADPVEKSQLPVDQLRFFLDGPGDAPLFGVVGHPVAHSASPGLHFAWMRARGHRGLYVALDIDSSGDLRRNLVALADGGFRGLNVTHPLKRAAFELAEERTPRCERAGVANTLTLSVDNVQADNTDVTAMAQRLQELRKEHLWPGDEFTVVGSGGAARAALVAGAELGCAIRLLARSDRQAEILSREFGAERVGPNGSSPTSLLVHATTSGQAGGTPLSVDMGPLVNPETYLLDFVYAAPDPWLREAARRQGARYEDGRRLLVYQAAETFRIWWGEGPTPAQVSAAVQEAECAA